MKKKVNYTLKTKNDISYNWKEKSLYNCNQNNYMVQRFYKKYNKWLGTIQ